jgi:very-short-patch-repair endonuclease
MAEDPTDVQDGVLAGQQAAALFGHSLVARRIRRGLWQTPLPHVIVCHNGPMTPIQRRWAALLACPKGSALGGWSALAFDGVPGSLDRPPHVLIPDKARKPRLDGVIVSHSRALGPADVHPDRLPRRTRPARSLVDAASRCTGPEAARLTLIEGVQVGASTTAQLAAVLATRGQCRHLGLLQETLIDLEGGIRSLPERQFTRLLERAGLPRPARQVPVRGPGGRYYLDADWPWAGVAAEVHGTHHGLVRQLDADWRRHNALTVGGRRVLHFSSFAVRRAPEQVAAVLAAALRSAAA